MLRISAGVPREGIKRSVNQYRGEQGGDPIFAATDAVSV